MTQSIETIRVEGDEDVLIVMDTPGLGSTDIPLSKVKQELLDAIGDLNYVLVFCHSVSPGHNAECSGCVNGGKKLQKALGKGIWNKYAVLLTFSDMVREQTCPEEQDREEYCGRL